MVCKYQFGKYINYKISTIANSITSKQSAQSTDREHLSLKLLHKGLKTKIGGVFSIFLPAYSKYSSE